MQRFETECWGQHGDLEVWLVIDRQTKKPVARLEVPRAWGFKAALAALALCRHEHTQEHAA